VQGRLNNGRSNRQPVATTYATTTTTTTTAPAQTTTTATAVDLGREKILRHQNANELDAFTTIAELMALGGKGEVPQGRTYSRLLSVTTV